MDEEDSPIYPPSAPFQSALPEDWCAYLEQTYLNPTGWGCLKDIAEISIYQRVKRYAVVVMLPAEYEKLLIRERLVETTRDADAPTQKNKTRRQSNDAPAELFFTECRRIVLRSTPARTSYPGINFDFLQSRASDFKQWMDENQLHICSKHPLAHYFLEKCFELVGTYQSTYLTKTVPKGLVPLVHNRVTGKRFLMNVDGKSVGAPANIQFVLYRGSKPELILFEPERTPYAREHRAAELLASNPDESIRLYLDNKETAEPALNLNEALEQQRRELKHLSNNLRA